MRRFGCLTVLLVIAFFSLSGVAHAAEIIYTGDKNKLQEVPSRLYSESAPSVFPGTIDSCLSSGNKVIINYDHTVAGVTNPAFVLGALSDPEDAVGNSVILLNGQVEYHICGGINWNGSSTGNNVSVSGGGVGLSIFGGHSNGSSRTNHSAVSGGVVGKNVIGGWSGSGESEGNTVTISGGDVGRAVYGGYSDDCGDVTGNSVIISGGSVGFGVYGGISENGNATNNSVIISGGSVGRAVYGGYSDDCGDVLGNIVTISGKPNLTKASIYGGFSKNGDKDALTGNILNLKSHSILARGVSKFEHYNFYLPEDLVAGGVMLSVAETVNLEGMTVAIFLQGSSELCEDDEIALIHSTAGIKNSPKNKDYKVQQGGKLYEFSIYTDSNNLWAGVTEISDAAK